MVKMFMLLSIILCSQLVISDSKDQENNPNCKQLQQSIDSFNDDPGSENAYIIYRYLAESQAPLENCNQIIYQIHFDTLEERIYNGDTNCLKLYYRLYFFTDGYIQEGISIFFGNYLKINPAVLLDFLKENYDSRFISHFPCAAYTEHYDSIQDLILDLKQRLYSVEEVRNSDNKTITTLVIDELEKCIKELENF